MGRNLPKKAYPIEGWGGPNPGQPIPLGEKHTCQADPSYRRGFQPGNRAAAGGQHMIGNQNWKSEGRGLKRGRPRTPVTAEFTAQLEKLAMLHATEDEIADFLGVNRRTLKRLIEHHPELKHAFEHGRASGKVSLRRLQFESAKGDPDKGRAPNVQMQMWLGKQILGQREAIATEVDQSITVNVSSAHEILRRKFDRIVELAAEEQLPALPKPGGG